MTEGHWSIWHKIPVLNPISFELPIFSASLGNYLTHIEVSRIEKDVTFQKVHFVAICWLQLTSLTPALTT